MLIGTPESDTFREMIFEKIKEKLPDYDVGQIILSTHTEEAGCRYLPLPPGVDVINPNDPEAVLPPGTVDDFPTTNIPRPDEDEF